MTERGKAVFDRIIRECAENGEGQGIAELSDISTRIKMNMPIPLDVRSYWSYRRNINDGSAQWKAVSNNYTTCGYNVKELLMIRPYHKPELIEKNPALGNIVEFAEIVKNDFYGKKIYAISGVLDVTQFLKEDMIFGYEQFLRDEGFFQKDECLSAVDVAMRKFYNSTKQIADFGYDLVSYTMKNPTLEDCFVDERQIADMLDSLGYHAGLDSPVGTIYEYRTPQERYYAESAHLQDEKTVEKTHQIEWGIDDLPSFVPEQFEVPKHELPKVELPAFEPDLPLPPFVPDTLEQKSESKKDKVRAERDY